MKTDIKCGDRVTYNDPNLYHYSGIVTHVYERGRMLCVDWHTPFRVSRPVKEWAPNLLKVETP